LSETVDAFITILSYFITFLPCYFYKVGDLECFGTCLVRRNWVGGPHTQVDPLLAHLPRAPPVPEFLMDRTWSVPLALLLVLPPAIMYDASV
jgi:hypothetical protein